MHQPTRMPLTGPQCPYCEQEVDEPGVQFGSSILHSACAAALNAELPVEVNGEVGYGHTYPGDEITVVVEDVSDLFNELVADWTGL